MEEIEKSGPKLPNQEIDYYKIVKILVSRWFWIVGSVVGCLILANVYLWYTPKIFATSGSMKFEDKKSEISDVVIPFGSNSDRSISKIQTETAVLQSTPLLLSAIKHLDYRISYFIKGRYFRRTINLYPEKPFQIDLIKFDSLNYFRGLVTFAPVNDKVFDISYSLSDKTIQKSCSYGKPFTIGATTFRIKKPAYISKSSEFLFKLNSAHDFVGVVRKGMRVNEVTKNSNIISLQETNKNALFAADVLNAIMHEYLNNDRLQKTQSASQTIQFIDEQLRLLAIEVNGAENSLKTYKEKNKIMDLTSATTDAFGKARELGSQRSLLNIQLLAIDQLKQDIVKEKDNLNLSFNLDGVVEEQLTYFINNLNNLIKERNTLLVTYQGTSQPIQDVNQQIITSKANALKSLTSTQSLIEDKVRFINNELLPVNQQISTLPATERDLTNLKRNFEVNEKVYSLLSEKKIDAQITKAGILPGAVIIDSATPNLEPVAPDKDVIIRASILVGIAIGLGLIVLIRILNPYIYDKETIESLTTTPIIGVIRKYPGKIDEFSSQVLVLQKPKSIFAESIRSVRANLNFLASEKQSKVICITSEVAGEGKSFVAVNLASTLSLINKKVILISADLRRSKLHKTFMVPNDLGLSNYLANQCEKEDIINVNQNNLSFIISGPVPPNPAELLHSERMTKLINELKLEYDFIMIDTAPVGLVADALPIVRGSDINLFVIRSGKSKFYAATIPQRLSQEYSLDNIAIVLNAFSEDILHSRYYNTKFESGSYSGRYYYYSDYSGYQNSGYYTDKEDEKGKWWDFGKWFK